MTQDGETPQSVPDACRLDLEAMEGRLRRLLDATACVHVAATEQEAIERVADAVVEAGWRRVAVTLLGDDWCVSHRACRGLTEEQITILRENPPTPEERQRMVGPDMAAYRVSRSVLIPGDLERSAFRTWAVIPSDIRAEACRDWNPRDVVYTPMYARDDRIVGFISMDDPVDGRRPTEDVLRYVESFVSLAASVVESIQLDRRRRAAEARQAWLMRELDHRIRNTLGSILHLAEFSARGSQTVDDFMHTFRGRLLALSNVHTLLSASKWDGMRLRELVELTLGPYDDPVRRRLEVVGIDCVLPPRVGAPLCMAMHELATNAVKHGALSCSEGAISLSWRFDGREDRPGRLTLDWRESIRPVDVRDIREGGFGATLITEAIRFELGGDVDLDIRPDGLRCRIDIDCERNRPTGEATADAVARPPQTRPVATPAR